MKKSYSLLELLLFIIIIGYIISLAIPKFSQKTDISTAVDKLVLNLNYTRYIAHLDNKENKNDHEWQKKLWTLKFQNCSSSVGGLYYVVYSDTSGGTSHFKKDECLKDPLTNKYLYSNYDCEASSDESKYILLTKEYGIKKVIVTCNTTTTIGQISFGYDGKIYSQLGENPKEIINDCIIELYDQNEKSSKIKVDSKTGYIQKL